jgi:hypothetical protein
MGADLRFGHNHFVRGGVQQSEKVQRCEKHVLVYISDIYGVALRLTDRTWRYLPREGAGRWRFSRPSVRE